MHVRSRWQLISIPAFVLALTAYFFQSSPLDAKDEVVGKDDITKQVELKITSPLQYAGKNKYDLRIVITNESKRTIRGPIMLAIEGTNVEQLVPLKADDKIDGKISSFVLMKADGQLKSGQSTKPRKIEFQAEDRLTSRARREFQLKHKVFRLRVRSTRESSKEEPKAEKKSKKTTERKKDRPSRPIPTGRPGRGNNDDPDGFRQPSEKEVERVIKAQDRFTELFLPKEGVMGTATGLDAKGKPEIKVYLSREGIKGVPESFEGVAIGTQVTGELITHWQTRSQSDPRARFERPVPIGVSVGNSRACSSGTIACRVRGTDGTLYALSNNHVLGLTNRARRRDQIIQPGRADSRCQLDRENLIGNEIQFVPIDHDSRQNRIDAAIAKVTATTLGTGTPPNGYGTPTSNIVRPRLRMKVQKYGRTTRLTHGRIVGINATSYVRFGRDQNTRFVRQIIVRGDSAGFIKGGDSGSLLVTDPDRDPCGLLFAGSRGGKYAVANPIESVLRELDVVIDDGSSAGDESRAGESDSDSGVGDGETDTERDEVDRRRRRRIPVPRRRGSPPPKRGQAGS